MIKRLIIFSLLIFCLFAHVTHLKAEENQELDSVWNNWKFRISPYFWYIGFQGTIYKPPEPTNLPIPPPPKYEIDVGFKDIYNSIKFAFMLAGQYRGEHLVAQFNFSSIILESEAITPLELVLQDNIIELTYFGGDLGIGYRVVKIPKFEFDAVLGAKFVYFKIGLNTNLAGIYQVEGERNKYYVDPVIGTNLVYRPHRKIEFIGYADFGPPFPDNINSYQAMVGASYVFTKTFLITFGYRYYHIDFPKENAIYNGNIKGWIMKVGFQF